MPNEYIGDVEIPAISEVDSSQEENYQEISAVGLDDPVVVDLGQELEELEIMGTLVKQIHSEDKDIGQQREDIKSLVRNNAGDHSFNYLDWTGHLSIESVDVPREENERNIINATISVQFLPYPEYQPGAEGGSTLVSNDFSIDRLGYFALPNATEDIRIFNKRLNTQRDISPAASDHGIDYYRFPYFYHGVSDMELRNGASETMVHEYSKLRGVNIPTTSDSVASIQEDILGGQYKIKARLQDQNVADSIQLTLRRDDGEVGHEEIVNTGTTAITVVETDSFHIEDDNKQYQIELDLLDGNNSIDVDSIWLEPQFKQQYVFEVPLSNFHAHTQEDPVRVYDNNGSATEADWDQVYDESHEFNGEPVIGNTHVRSYGNLMDAYIYSGGNWHKFQVAGNDWNPSRLYITNISPEVVEWRVENEDRDGNETKFEGRLRRGAHLIEYEVLDDTTANTSEWYCTPDSYKYSVFVDSIHHDTDTATSNHNNTNTDNWASVFDPNEDHIVIYSGNQTDLPGQIRDDTGNDVDGVRWSGKQEGSVLYLGAIPFSESPKLYAEAESADTSKSGGTYTDHWNMALNHTDGKRELHKDKSNFTLDDTNGILEHTRDGLDEVYLHALDFGPSIGGNNYRQQVVGSDTTGAEEARLLWCWTDTNNHYQSVLDFTNGSIEVAKLESGSRTVINSTAFTFTYGTNYNHEIEFDPANGAIDVYVWDSANAKPSTPTVTATDSTYSDGQVGYAAYGSVDLHDWSVDAEESTSSGNSAIIVETDSISGTNSPNVQYDVTIGTDVPKGTYIAAIRAKDTLGTTASTVTMETQNVTDAENLAIDGGSTYKEIQSELGYDYSYAVRELRMDSDDDGDTLKVAIYNTESTNAGHIVVDELILIPVSLEEFSRLGVQDIAHEALLDWERRPIVKGRKD